jgi:hypothetical protein
VNIELERMWKEAGVASFKVLFHNFYGGMEENDGFLHCSG